MKIVLVPGSAADQQDVDVLRSILADAGIEAIEVERPAGAISFMPCIAALDDGGVARECFGVGAPASEIIEAAKTTPAPILPVPINPGNPYFGKKPNGVGDFWGLILLVYIAMAGGDNNIGNDRYARLTESRRAKGIVRVINGQNVIDVDDKDGHFLQFLAMLLATDHEDGSGKLMTVQERDAVMGAWE